MRILLRLALPLVAVILTGCIVEYKVVGKFDDYNEVFIGTVKNNVSTGGAIFQIEAINSKVSCDGVAGRPDYMSIGCAGQSGRGEAVCTDGRSLKFNWYGTSCYKGYGKGVSSDGIKFQFAFGQNEETAKADLDKLLAEVSNKPEYPGYRPKEVRKEKGFATGSGFFVTNNGVLVTNNHVIDGSSEIFVVDTLTKKEYKATLLQVDPSNDVAVLKIEANSSSAPLADRFTTMKGEEVFTLGYPLIQLQGQEQKATFGRVNALSGIKDDIRFAQIDVSIQPGNSGGPLFNNKGQVVGVVTATLDQMVALKASGSLPQNVNFAVKVDYVLPLLRMALKDQELKTGGGDGVQDIPKLVNKLESSVVLIVAK